MGDIVSEKLDYKIQAGGYMRSYWQVSLPKALTTLYKELA